MSLIDANKLIKRLEDWNTNDDMDKALYNFAMIRIIEQPIAYDVEKVLSELEVLLDLVNMNQKLAVMQAIDIVRKGGVK